MTRPELPDRLHRAKAVSIYDIAMLNFKAGAYGTPKDPRRGSLHRCAFWDAYFGAVHRHIPGSICAAHARAGRHAALKATKKRMT